MTEVYIIAVACLLVAAFKFGKRRALRKLRVTNTTNFQIEMDVIPNDVHIVIKSVANRE